MLESASILICEDEPFIALDLVLAVEEAGGVVIGPAASVAEAWTLLAVNRVSGAILDVNLVDGDVTPIAEALLTQFVPVIFQTGLKLPEDFVLRWPNVIVFPKPARPAHLIDRLASDLKRIAGKM